MPGEMFNGPMPGAAGSTGVFEGGSSAGPGRVKVGAGSREPGGGDAAGPYAGRPPG